MSSDVLTALRLINRFPRPAQPWDDLWRAMAVEHQTRDEWWERRSLIPMLADVRIPVYLGSEWTNVPLHLGGTLAAWEAMRDNPDVRLAILPEHGLPWPWESMHVEALAWFDQWLKGRDTGILDGPRVRYWMPGADEWRTSDTWPPPAEYLEVQLGDGDRSYATYEPQSLTWTAEPLAEALEVAGLIELRLDATITADDTGWIVLLQDVAPERSRMSPRAGCARRCARWTRRSVDTVHATSRLLLPVLTPRR
jgi:predicted acyl esterase